MGKLFGQVCVDQETRSVRNAEMFADVYCPNRSSDDEVRVCEEIALRFNAHEALVEALKQIDERMPLLAHQESRAEARSVIRAALEKAGAL